MELLILILAGLLGGVLAGMLGIGGGIVYVVIYNTYLMEHMPPGSSSDMMVKVMIANAAFALIFAGAIGCYRHWKADNFYLKPVMAIGIPSSIAAITTTFLLSLSKSYSHEKFTIVFVAILIPVIVKMIISKPQKPKEDLENIRFSRAFPIVGIVAGTITALSGLGGGFIIVPVLSGLLAIPLRQTNSISLGTIALTALSLSFFNVFYINYASANLGMHIGPLILPMAIPVIAGVMMGAPLGVMIALRIDQRITKTVFVIFCLVVVLKSLYPYIA